MFRLFCLRTMKGEAAMYNLMVVDDENLTIEYMKINIPKLLPNWTVTGEASNGTQALDVMRTQDFDLIITDIKMPVMDGLDFCKILYQNNYHGKIVILSGFEEFDFAKRAISYGIVDYLLKPIVKQELIKTILKIEDSLIKEREKDAEKKYLKTLSDNSEESVIRTFLKSVISNSEAEIKSLYPLINRMNISLGNCKYLILLFKINEFDLIKKGIAINKFSSMQHKLNSIACDIVKSQSNYVAFYDQQGNTCLLLKCENEENIKEISCNIFSEISQIFYKKTEINIIAALGTIQNNIFQLDMSFESAEDRLNNHFFSISNELISNDAVDKSINDINNTLDLIKSSILENNKVNCNLFLTRYVEKIEKTDMDDLILYGIYLINSINSLYSNNAAFKVKALTLLNKLSKEKEKMTKEDFIDIFSKISFFIKNNNPDIKEIDDLDIISKSVNYIYRHYAEPLSLEQIADNFCISPSYLSYLFHKAKGESYMKFLTRIRMEQAGKLLRTNPNYKIYTIAESVGYVSVKHFSYIFKNFYNMTPGEYKKNT